MQTFQSGFETTLALRLDPSDTTATLASVPTVTKGRMYLDNWEQKEWIKFTGVSGSTITGLVRGLSQTADPATAGTWLTWIAGTKIKLVAMHDQMLDRLEWDDALISAVVYADTTARDAELWGDGVATINYTNIKTTADWLFWRYNTTTGVWEAIDTGTVTANASATVAGKVELATEAEGIAGTATGGTGASLDLTPDLIAKITQSGSWVYCASATGSDTYTANLTPSLTAYTTGMLLPCKFTTTNTGACSININSLGAKNIKTLDGNDPQTWVIRANGTALLMYDGTNFVIQSEDFATTSNKGIIEIATDAEVSTGTDTARSTTPAQLRANSKTSAWTTSRTASDSTGSQTIAHWLGMTPRLVELKYVLNATIWAANAIWFWTYDWSTSRSIWIYDAWATADYLISTWSIIQWTNSSWAWWSATCTVDATNITLSWTKDWAWLNLLVMRTAHA